MIAGIVQNLEGVVGVDVTGPGQHIQRIEAVIDTGYNGYLTLPGHYVNGLQLSFAGHRRGRLAVGTVILLEMYQAKVKWHGRQRDVLVSRTDGFPVLGMAMMEGSRLTMDIIDQGDVTIETLPNPGGSAIP